MLRLENDFLAVEVAEFGAELQRIYDKRSQKDVLWDGNPDVWTSRAPWLFPIIGQLRDKKIRIRGQEYALPMHGFASKSLFAAEKRSETEAEFTLCANEETMKVYPWPFVLRILYRLDGAALGIRVQISCSDNQSMDFSFGAHPGFLCAEGDSIVFPADEQLSMQRLELATHLLAPESTAIPSKIVLREALFDDDAMLIHRPKSTKACLLKADGSSVHFDFGPVPWVGIWSKKRKGLQYVCIEPWYGVDDPVDAQGDMENKLDIVHLPAGETFEMNLRITPI